MIRTVSYPFGRIILGVAGLGRLRWAGIAIRPRKTEGWQGLKRAMGPIKMRWGLVLILALALLLVWGEMSPAASAIISTIR
jgi:hypothetical protein